MVVYNTSLGRPSFSCAVRRLTGLTRTYSVRIGSAIVRGLRQPISTSCIKHKGTRRVGARKGVRSTGVLVIGSRLAPVRVEGLNSLASVGVVSQATLVLRVFTSETHSGRTGLRIRVTGLHVDLPELRASGSGIGLSRRANNNDNSFGDHNNNRAGLRGSEHIVNGHVDVLGGRLGSVRRGRGIAHGRHSTDNLESITLINCAGTNGSAAVGNLLETYKGSSSGRIFRGSVLFTALSASIHELRFGSGGSFLVDSAIKFISRLPRRLIRTFGSALSRTTGTSLLIRIVSISSPGCHSVVGAARRALGRVNIRGVPVVCTFGGTSLARTPCPRVLKGRVACSTGSPTSVRGVIRLVGRGVFGSSHVIAFGVPFSRKQCLSRLGIHNAILRAACRRSNAIISTGISPRLRDELDHFRAR